MLRECIYCECAHEQHVSRTLTLTLTHTITAYSVSGNVVRVRVSSVQLDKRALSRISPRVRVRVSVSIVYRIATGGYSWIWPTKAV